MSKICRQFFTSVQGNLFKLSFASTNNQIIVTAEQMKEEVFFIFSLEENEDA